MEQTNHFLWTEKYRPNTLEECILPDRIKDIFRPFIKAGQIPNFIFSGTAGLGKTTLAKALCKELNADVLFINNSEDNGIDVLRSRIRTFASKTSLRKGAKKIVILDEFDNSSSSFQPALRGFIEEFANNCRFIATCNFVDKIIEPLQSRLTVIDFKILPTEKAQMAAKFFKATLNILNTENIKYDKAVVAELLNKFYPDFRRTLSKLQTYSGSGEIDTGILVQIDDSIYLDLVKQLKAKSFTEMRKWVGKNNDITIAELFKHLYNKCYEYMEQSSIPELILILGEYEYKSSFVTNKDIITVAALTEIMSTCKFK